MTLTTDTPNATATVKKSGSTVSGRFTLKNLPTFDAAEVKKPLFAYVGVADLAIERAKEIPAELTAATTTATKKAQSLLADVPAQAKALPVTVRSNVEKATEKATEVYNKLTVRGERLVKAIRRQPATKATIAEGKDAVRKAEAAAAAARRTVKTGEKAVEDAASKIG